MLINGFSDIGPDEQVRYLDEPAVEPFWARAAQLGTPTNLHPREPLPSQRRALQGYPELIGLASGFAYETSTHAVRLMLSGPFDRHRGLQVILGHLGVGLPFMISRLEPRLDKQRNGEKGATCKRRLSHYWSRNFYVTTSGHFHTQPLLQTNFQDGADRVLFSADYPFEEMAEAARWFDDLPMEPGVKRKLGRANADRLFHLGLDGTSQAQALGSSS